MAVAIFVARTGGPEVLEAREHDPGAPGPNQVRVATRACGVNFVDVYFRTGLYPRPVPFVSGMEGAGTVEAIGPGVTGLAPGDRVAWAGVPSSYADRVIAPADRVVKLPAGIADDVAAAAMLQGMTAHYLCRSTYPVKPGDTALVHAAAGGVGLLLCQMLRALGATVIGTCGGPDKEKLAREAGADHVIRYNDVPAFSAEVRRLTGGRGVDVAYDSVGRTTFDESLKSLRPRGMLALYGQSSGPVPPFELRRLNDGSQFITRPSLAHYTADRGELELRAGEVLDAIAQGRLHVRIGARFPLAQAAAAHRALEGRATTGKVLLIP